VKIADIETKKRLRPRNFGAILPARVEIELFFTLSEDRLND
jgi:hypothetical protein